jgi:hypothetical protein
MVNRNGYLAVSAVFLAAGDVSGGGPIHGEIQRLQVITISLHAGSTDKDTKQVTYAPPPGWFVRSHFVQCPVKTGHSSFSVNTVPQNWRWSSETTIEEKYRRLIEWAAKTYNVALQTKLQHERERLLRELHNVRATHHALVVEATARGEGFLRGGGRLELTVIAEMVYRGTD